MIAKAALVKIIPYSRPNSYFFASIWLTFAWAAISKLSHARSVNSLRPFLMISSHFKSWSVKTSFRLPCCNFLFASAMCTRTSERLPLLASASSRLRFASPRWANRLVYRPPESTSLYIIMLTDQSSCWFSYSRGLICSQISLPINQRWSLLRDSGKSWRWLKKSNISSIILELLMRSFLI